MIQQINLAKLGNQKAFTILYDFYWKRVYFNMLKTKLSLAILPTKL